LAHSMPWAHAKEKVQYTTSRVSRRRRRRKGSIHYVKVQYILLAHFHEFVGTCPWAHAKETQQLELKRVSRN
jgi:hypothetical protein